MIQDEFGRLRLKLIAITLACLVLSAVVFFYPYLANRWKCRLKNGG